MVSEGDSPPAARVWEHADIGGIELLPGMGSAKGIHHGMRRVCTHGCRPMRPSSGVGRALPGPHGESRTWQAGDQQCAGLRLGHRAQASGAVAALNGARASHTGTGQRPRAVRKRRECARVDPTPWYRVAERADVEIDQRFHGRGRTGPAWKPIALADRQCKARKLGRWCPPPMWAVSKRGKPTTAPVFAQLRAGAPMAGGPGLRHTLASQACCSMGRPAGRS